LVLFSQADGPFEPVCAYAAARPKLRFAYLAENH